MTMTTTAATAPSLSPGLAGAPAASQRTLRRLAAEFEAQAVAAMFQPVFAALPTDGPFGGGHAEAQWRPLLVEAIARDMARAGGIGIGDAVHRELLRAQEGAPFNAGGPA
ncbi:rod-binding protein [Falsiroseomonas oryzae]|uniref:rod-binding protein n=1 Tax=Falsiroseomonas oryzae TaxID=2766473 RepID=UPI0022EA2D74|nr:rod-binding protein [Roseomonas sp. MO-31]